MKKPYLKTTATGLDENVVIHIIKDWQLQADSPYNDGWVSQGYKEKLRKVREALEIADNPNLIT
jgi:hypothetical protein